MILYHGTTIPTEVIRTQGLRVHNVELILNFILMRLKNPLITARDLRWALRRGTEWFEWGTLRFSAFYDTVREYTMGPPELITQALLERLPLPLALGAVEALMEVSNGQVLGKIVTVNIPESWIIDYEEIMREEGLKGMEELVVDRDVGPQYITKIDLVYTAPLEKILKGVVVATEEKELAEYFMKEVGKALRGPPSGLGRRYVLW